ncbi:putative phosphoglycerate dehydrogenase protein (plasmid) [Gordonia polyisoprenivorans VH2]|uniref:Putative phosphoglycerate dehydrogenase protein n=2 Tax=Gordonia polyisoprenivorans TaxID=84595 RepID=H6N4Y1_GORPV|nr:putative phosphoglycerate dehydrogenase protein [Gordonia polyisoprenivorans VH2]
MTTVCSSVPAGSIRHPWVSTTSMWPPPPHAAVAVTNVTDYCVDEVSDHAVGFILDWTRGITVFDRDVTAGSWNPAGAQLKRLRDRTIGIVGLGRIGRATASKLAAFGCQILVHTTTPDGTAGVEFVSLQKLLFSSDVVVLHAPLSSRTHHLIDAQHLSFMRSDALLVNVSRGGLIDTEALVAALKAGHLAGVALDVLDEKPDVDPYVCSHPRVVITPHVAFSSDASVTELRTKAAEDVVRALAGQPPHYPCNTTSLTHPTTLEEAR